MFFFCTIFCKFLKAEGLTEKKNLCIVLLPFCNSCFKFVIFCLLKAR